MMARIMIIQSTYPVARRMIHYSLTQNIESKASFATIVPEKSSSKTTNVPLTPSNEEKNVAKVEDKPLSRDVHERRDFHWSHPIYSKEEYEAVQVTVYLPHS